jgi:hypothetical protein
VVKIIGGLAIGRQHQKNIPIKKLIFVMIADVI